LNFIGPVRPLPMPSPPVTDESMSGDSFLSSKCESEIYFQVSINLTIPFVTSTSPNHANIYHDSATNMYTLFGLNSVTAKTISITEETKINCLDKSSLRTVQKYQGQDRFSYILATKRKDY